MPSARPCKSLRFLLAFSACLLAHVFAADIPADRSNGATIEWPASGALSFRDGDTLEFALRLPTSIVANAPDDALPTIGVWFLESGTKEIPKDAPQNGRALTLRSARTNEWIVQVRGFKPPKENAALDLHVRWSFTTSDASLASGEVRYQGSVVFGTKPIDIVMLMDGSWSMELSDPKRKRVAAVRDLIATARNSAAIGRIAIVQFDTKSKTLIPLTPVTENFDKAIASINTDGMTDIDGGIRHALSVIEPERRNGAAIVLFTDGVQEPGEYRNAHAEAQKAGVAIHTMTLGADADRKLLKRVAEETGGSYADAEKDNDISSAYAAIVGRLTSLRTITVGSFNTAATSISVPVDRTCSALSLTTVSDKPGVLNVLLPDDKKWSSGEASNPQSFIEKPATGAWSATWAAKDNSNTPVQFSASARTTLYPLFFRASPLPAAPIEFDANDPRLAVSLFDAGEPVEDATLEARFEYSIALEKGTYKNERTVVSLFDDGQHGEGKARDGIYAADIESLGFLSKPAEIAKGTVLVIATGTRNGEPFRRELQSPFIIKRNAPPALVVTGTYDLGEKFAGDTITGAIQLRVRGIGGALKTSLDNTPEKLAGLVRLVEVPSSLKPKEKRQQILSITLPDLLPPGDYNGSATLAMEGVASVSVPWRVKVLPVTLVSEPKRLDLGNVFPGAVIKIKLKIATVGGTLPLASIDSLYLKNKPFDAFALDTSGRDIDIEIAIPETAQAGDVSDALLFKDASNRERARIPVSFHVQPVTLTIDAKLDFGPVESGDTLKREIVLKWDNGANVPITPRLVAAPSDFKPELSALDPRASGWANTFSLSLPAQTKSGPATGTINVEAGPFKTQLAWSATIIKPSITTDAPTLDFGRVFPSRHSERKLTIRAESVRPSDIEISIATPFHKPRVAGIELPSSALVFTQKLRVEAGSSITLPLTLTLPDDAQDGRYDTVLHITSRLGNLDIPMTVKSVNVVDAAAFHVAPTSMNFKIVEGEVLPIETLNIFSHDDEPLQVIVKIPAPTVVPSEAKSNDPNAPPPRPPDPVAFVLNTTTDREPVASLNLTLPPRGSISIAIRPRPDARDGESGAIHLDGAGEHQEVGVRVQRIVSQASVITPPEPPKILNWIISLIVLTLIITAFLAKKYVKQSGIRFVCYAVVIHLIVFSLVMPQKALLDALPESFEVSLLDAQESLGMAMSDQQARRLDALHSGTGGGDDKRAPVLAQAALPEKEGPVELPTPGAGFASPRPGPINLDAARGVERPVRPADVPEPARGSPSAPVVNDAPLAFDSDKPTVTAPPAAAEKVSTESPRAATASPLQSTASPVAVPTNFANVEAPRTAPSPRAIQSSAVPRTELSASIERPSEAPRKPVESAEVSRRTVQAIDDAPLSIATDAPLAFDNQPAASPSVKPNPKAPPADLARNIPVSANSSDLGAPGLGTLNAPVVPLALSATGIPGRSASGPGESSVALARTSALPVADASAGFGGGAHGGTIGNSVSDSIIGTGFGRESGGLPKGGEEPLDIGTNGGNGPGAKATGSGEGSAGGKGSGDGRSLIGGMKSGNSKTGPGGSGGSDGFGGLARTTAAGGGGLGGSGTGFATGGSGTGTADFGLPNGNGNAWHGRPGGKGGGVSLAPGRTSEQLEAAGGSGGGTGGGGNGGTGTGVASFGPAKGSGVGGIPKGTGVGPGGRVPGGFGINGDGPGGMGDKPLAVGPAGGGGIKPVGTGIASGGGDTSGRGGGGGFGVGRTGPAGGTALVGGGGGSGLGGVGGSGIAGGNGRPGGGKSKSVSVERGSASNELDELGGLKSQTAAVISTLPHRGIESTYSGGIIHYTMGVAVHSGDWDSSRFALPNLRNAFIERSKPLEVEVSILEVRLGDLAAMKKCKMIMMTSNKPVQFTPNEIASIRGFVAAGGIMWVNDSTDSLDQTFDESFRPQAGSLIPNATFQPMPIEHDFFVSCYDLSHGYKGSRVPPGDKLRLDYLEAIFLPDPSKSATALKKSDPKNIDAEIVDLAATELLNHRRAGIIYTRNDYADGLQKDPRNSDGMDSLTDLTKPEMLEASLHFGLNLIAYSMGQQGLKLPPPPDTVAEFEKVNRYKGPPLPVIDDYTKLLDQWAKPTWLADSKEFFNESALEFVPSKTEKGLFAQIICSPGTKYKAAVTRFGDCDFSKTSALVFDVHSSFPHGLNISLMFYSKDKSAYESRPVFVRPGWNKNIRFPLDMNDMKSSIANEPWKNYNTPFEPRNSIERFSITVHNQKVPGTIRVGPIREQK